MTVEPTPVVLRIPTWSGRGTLAPRAEAIPSGRRRGPLQSGGWDDRFFWKERAGDRAGLVLFDTRIAWTCRDLAEVVVHSVGPAKGAGWFELVLAWKDEPGWHAILVTDRWHERDRDWFEEVGGSLAKLLGVAYRFEMGADA